MLTSTAGMGFVKIRTIAVLLSLSLSSSLVLWWMTPPDYSIKGKRFCFLLIGSWDNSPVYTLQRNDLKSSTRKFCVRVFGLGINYSQEADSSGLLFALTEKLKLSFLAYEILWILLTLGCYYHGFCQPVYAGDKGEIYSIEKQVWIKLTCKSSISLLLLSFLPFPLDS